VLNSLLIALHCVALVLTGFVSLMGFLSEHAFLCRALYSTITLVSKKVGIQCQKCETSDVLIDTRGVDAYRGACVGARHLHDER